MYLSSVTLAPGETREILVSLSVDNTVVPNQSNAPYAYDGELRAQSSAETLRVPFAFIKSSMLNLVFTEEPWVVLVHNRVDQYWWNPYPGTSLWLLLPQGTYDIIVTYGDVATRVIKEGIAVDTVTALDITKADATYDVTIIPIDKDGNRIYCNFGGERILHKGSGIGQLFMGGFDTNKHFSAVSGEYSWEWAISTGTYNNVTVYDFNGYANNGISSDIVFQNQPSDFKHVTYQYMMPPTVDEVFILHWLSSGPRGGGPLVVTTCTIHPYQGPSFGKHTLCLYPMLTSTLDTILKKFMSMGVRLLTAGRPSF